jgi:thiol:disulfide interchange protein DsbC
MNSRYALILLGLLPLAALAADKPALIDKADPRVALAAKIQGTKPEDLRATPVAGIYELTHGADVSYVTADAKFVFSGDLFRVATQGDFPNLTEDRRRELRAKLIGEVPESQMMVFGPRTAKHTVTVFTDVDCPWCRRLHSQIAEYNRLGIRVRYLMYPRTGPDTESWAKAESIWCTADHNKALTRSKNGESLAPANCKNTPVRQQWELGRELGVTGTPGLVLESGELVPGYLSPPQLLAHLQPTKAAALN